MIMLNSLPLRRSVKLRRAHRQTQKPRKSLRETTLVFSGTFVVQKLVSYFVFGHGAVISCQNPYSLTICLTKFTRRKTRASALIATTRRTRFGRRRSSASPKVRASHKPATDMANVARPNVQYYSASAASGWGQSERCYTIRKDQPNRYLSSA